jgi:L-serine deaminase
MFGPVPSEVIIRFYGSFASTWKGHGSADAAIAGLLGIPPEDEDLFRGREKLAGLQECGQGFTYEIITVKRESFISGQSEDAVIRELDRRIAVTRASIVKGLTLPGFAPRSLSPALPG